MEKREFTVRELTSRGWKRREDLDFRDDGTKFKAFEYTNGLIATYTKAEGEYYLALRIDYIGDLLFEEYSKMDSYGLADEFNGVKEVDAERVCRNAEIIMMEYLELKKEVEKMDIDMVKIIEQVKKEKSIVDRVLAESNVTLENLENIDNYDLRRLKEYRSTIKKNIDTRIEYLADGKYNNRQLRQMIYKINNSGYLVVDANGYYVNNIRKIVGKAKGQL